jgi:hypothetical protein
MRRTRTLCALVAVVTVAVALGGCGLPLVGSTAGSRPAVSRAAAPGRTSSPSTTAGTGPAARIRATVARAQRTHEVPTPAPAQQALGGWRSPVQAVQVFAQTYINWTADTVATRLRVLAQAAIGQARSAMRLAASQVVHDDSLKLGGIANTGTVEGIAPVTGENDVYAVVTREQTTATNTGAYQGLRPAWHVTLATVTKVYGWLWTISAWQPES